MLVSSTYKKLCNAQHGCCCRNVITISMVHEDHKAFHGMKDLKIEWFSTQRLIYLTILSQDN